MGLKKLLVMAVVVALGVSACGGDDSTDEVSAGENDVNTEPAAADAADGPEPSEDHGSTAESADEADTGADGGDVDAVELFTAIADATVAEGGVEFEATGSNGTTVAGAISTGSSLDESSMRIMEQAAGIETTVVIVDGQISTIFNELAEGAGPPVEGSWMTIDPAGGDPFMPRRIVQEGTAFSVPAAR